MDDGRGFDLVRAAAEAIEIERSDEGASVRLRVPRAGGSDHAGAT
jgi:hypothetical protein